MVVKKLGNFIYFYSGLLSLSIFCSISLWNWLAFASGRHLGGLYWARTLTLPCNAIILNRSAVHRIHWGEWENEVKLLGASRPSHAMFYLSSRFSSTRRYDDSGNNSELLVRSSGCEATNQTVRTRTPDLIPTFRLLWRSREPCFNHYSQCGVYLPTPCTLEYFQK